MGIQNIHYVHIFVKISHICTLFVHLKINTYFRI